MQVEVISLQNPGATYSIKVQIQLPPETKFLLSETLWFAILLSKINMNTQIQALQFTSGKVRESTPYSKNHR